MSIFIQIDKTTAITTDTYAWHISKYKKYVDKHGRPIVKWVKVRHYASLEQLIKAEADQRIRDSDARTFTEVLESRDNAVETLKTALAPYNYKISVVKE